MLELAVGGKVLPVAAAQRLRCKKVHLRGWVEGLQCNEGWKGSDAGELHQAGLPSLRWRLGVRKVETESSDFSSGGQQKSHWLNFGVQNDGELQLA